jgi:hypothetical protein
MPNIRIKDIPTTASATSSTDFIAIDGATNGTRKLSADSPVFGGNVTVNGNVANFGGSNSSPIINFKPADTGSVTLKFGGTTSPDKGRIVYSDNSDFFGFFTANAERARLNSTGNLLVGGTTDITGSGGLKVFGTTASTSTTTGALQVAGGVGVAGASFFGGNVAIPGDLKGVTFNVGLAGQYHLHYAAVSPSFPIRLALASDNITQRQFQIGYYTGDTTAGAWNSSFFLNARTGAATFSGDLTVSGTTASTSTTTGALTVAGGVGVGGDVRSGGNVIGEGKFGTNTTATPANIVNTGWRSFANSLAGAIIQGFGTTSDVSLVNKNSESALSVLTGTRNIKVEGTTASTSTTTGALQVAGGVGVEGAAFFGGAIAIGNTVNTVTATLPNRTITMVIGGTTYYIHAKTTND